MQLRCRMLSGSLYVIAHTWVLQKPGIRCGSFRLRCCTIFWFLISRVHVRQKQAIGGHGSCDGDCSDMRVELKESVVMCVLLRCLCLALVDTIVRGGHVNVW